jgi:hypothetical protein
MLALKAFARLVQTLLMAVIALIGLGVGLYCLDGLISLGSARPDRLLHLPRLRFHVGHFLAQIATPGPDALLAFVAGVVAVIVGLLLLIGLLGTRRERLLVIESDDERGTLAARPRTISQMVRDETERAPGITGVKRPKVTLARSGRRGRLKVLAARGSDPDAATVDNAVHERLDPIAERLNLAPNIRVRLVEPKAAREAREKHT